MSDLTALKERRDHPSFQDWKPYVADERIAAAVASITLLIDEVVSLGEAPNEEDARKVVGTCVARFNELDDGWIMTIEREDIADAILGVVRLAGFEADDDWIDDREW
jgi:hypothetical protein